MASIKDKLLTGLVGPVIISHRYGKTYIRSKPSRVKNPRTPGQVNQRVKFKAATQFVSRNLDELIRPYWNPEARRNAMSGQNLFCKLNTHAFDSNGLPDITRLKLTTGNLGEINNLKLEIAGSTIIRFIWDNNSRDKKTSEENQFKLFGMNLDLVVKELPCDAIRENETFVLDFKKYTFSYLFCFFWNPQLQLASKSEWIDCT
ncbi:hypothetical protein DWB61_03010 [Ancylomarina euxinus]|uniref:Uncharacterized protein n=1 Tax=Ancylomarina euxinus TaxID=2283627 RepID=A0A425Y743_9BACT|nr:DUF6266 family protein [Ancylomarina euxinus]MCZ4694027.1 DUF6266 family protein [Ancylomarina euxinus]MUP14553.1 hypothetical protein [Ancylomarina euxinus]RRG24102.1 hypothetical protein DWB61_03010 [Ancylomarina euxinus]